MAKNYNIALIGGDGTGPEVAREGVKVVQAAARKFGFTLTFTSYEFGAARYLKTGETLSGRVGDFNGDGFIDGTLVAVGVMPLTSPVYPGQPFAMSRNFETDILIDGAVYGSPGATNKAYGLAPGDGIVKGAKQ